MNKKIIAGVMSVAMLATMSSTPIFATGEVNFSGAGQATTGEQTINYVELPAEYINFNSETGTITGLKDIDNVHNTINSFLQDNPNIKIPEKINNVNVKVISLGKKIIKATAIKIPTTVEKIDHHAFVSHTIQTVDMSGCTNLKSIGQEAFVNCPVKNINMSGCSSLEKIGYRTFYGSGVETIDMTGCTALKTIENQSFQYAAALKTIKTRTESRDNIIDFSGCKNLQTIGEQAFHLCESLENIDFSGCPNLQTISKYTFVETKLKNANFSGCTNLQTIGGGAFSYCQSFENINFSGCTNLQTIGESAFGYCESLENIDFSGCTNLQTISKYTFVKTKLKNANFSGCKKLQTIGEVAFGHCQSLENIDFSGCTNLQTISKYTFVNTKIKNANFSNSGLKNIEQYAFPDNTIIDITGNQQKLETVSCPVLIKNANNYIVYGDVTLNQNLAIENEQKLIIPDAAKLTIPAEKTLTNNGTIENNGTVTGEGKVNNSGTIISNKGFVNENYIETTEEGYKVNGTVTLKQDLTIENGKTLTIPADTTLTVSTDKTLTNNGIIENNGMIKNNGTVINKGTLTNKNTMTNDGTLTNNKTVTNSENGTIDNKGKIETKGAGAKTENKGIVNNNSGASITTGDSATIENNGKIDNTKGGTVEGTITGNGEIKQPSEPPKPDPKPEPNPTPSIPSVTPTPDPTPSYKPTVPDYDYKPSKPSESDNEKKEDIKTEVKIEVSDKDFTKGSGNVEVKNIDKVPVELKNKFTSVKGMLDKTMNAVKEYIKNVFEKAKDDIKGSIPENIKFEEKNTMFFDAEMKSGSDGNTILPMPKGIDPKANKFLIAHIMDNGKIEVVEGKVTENGIEVKLNGLSPVMITWFSSDLSAGEGMTEVEETI